MELDRPRSKAWFILPVFMGIIGGLISYFAVRHDDRDTAKKCLYVGIASTVAWAVINTIITNAIGEMLASDAEMILEQGIVELKAAW